MVTHNHVRNCTRKRGKFKEKENFLSSPKNLQIFFLGGEQNENIEK